MPHPGVETMAPAPAPAGAIVSAQAMGEPTAAERLARSRDEIRQAIAELSAPPPRLAALQAGGAGASPLDTVLEKILTLPGVDIVVDTAQSWWRHHPWRAVGMVVADAGHVAAAPIARRHPVALVLGAALFGAVLLRWGPWSWVAKRTLLAGLVPRLATRIAATVPLESWLSALAILRRRTPVAARGSAARTP